MIRPNLLEDSLNLNMTGSHTSEVRLVLNALAAGSSDALCPCRRFSSTREPFSKANGYGMKHDEANMLSYILLNPTTEASPVCNSLQLCIETPTALRCLFMAWFLDSQDLKVLYIFLWLQVSNLPDQACWSQSGMPSGWGKGATPWPARLRLVLDRGSWAAPNYTTFGAQF